MNLANILKMPVTGAHLSLLNNVSQVPKFPMPNVLEYPINLSALVPQVPECSRSSSALIPECLKCVHYPNVMSGLSAQVA